MASGIRSIERWKASA